VELVLLELGLVALRVLLDWAAAGSAAVRHSPDDRAMTAARREKGPSIRTLPP
jgi:hypothetical protein